MSLMKWEKDESVAILTMTNRENRHNLDFVKAMKSTLDEILQDKSVQSLVITSNDEKNWSQGIDLDWFVARYQGGEKETIKEFLFGMNDVFKKLLSCPVPVIAALNGHTFANGAIMSCACDFRFMRSDRGYFCLPEIDVNIPFLPGMIGIMKKAIPYQKFQEMTFTGKRYTAPELEAAGVIVKACANIEETRREAIAFAKTFKKERGIFGEMKARMYRDIFEIMDTQDVKYFFSLELAS